MLFYKLNQLKQSVTFKVNVLSKVISVSLTVVLSGANFALLYIPILF